MLPTKDRTLADKQSRQRNHPPTSLPDPWCRRVTQNNNAMPLHRILSRWLGSTWIFQMDPQNGSFFVLKTIHFAGWLFWPPDFQGDIRPLPALWGACTRMGRTEPWKAGSWDKNLWELWECRESPTSCGLEQLFHFIYVHRFIVIFFCTSTWTWVNTVGQDACPNHVHDCRQLTLSLGAEREVVVEGQRMMMRRDRRSLWVPNWAVSKTLGPRTLSPRTLSRHCVLDPVEQLFK